MLSVFKQTILTLLQNGNSYHKVATQTYVRYSIVRTLHFINSHTLPRKCSPQDRRPLVRKVASACSITMRFKYMHTSILAYHLCLACLSAWLQRDRNCRNCPGTHRINGIWVCISFFWCIFRHWDGCSNMPSCNNVIWIHGLSRFPTDDSPEIFRKYHPSADVGYNSRCNTQEMSDRPMQHRHIPRFFCLEPQQRFSCPSHNRPCTRKTTVCCPN